RTHGQPRPGKRAPHHGRIPRLQPRRRHDTDRLARPSPDGRLCHAHASGRARPLHRYRGGAGMRRWLRQHHYALMVSLRRLAKQPFSSIANVLVIALSLTLPIVGASILLSAQPVLREVSVSPQLTLFL